MENNGPVVRLTGRPGAGAYWDRTHWTARREIWLLGHDHWLAAERATGVRRRTMIDRTQLGTDDRLASLLHRARRGESIRVVAEIPTDMLIIDRRWALVPVVVDGRCSEVLQVCGSNLLTTLVASYQTWWQGAVPLAELVDPPGTAPADVRLIALLAAGLTDKSIAKELGLGLRTVQRQVRTLLDRLSARSRFQAGLQLGRLSLAVREPEPNLCAHDYFSAE